MNQDKKETEVTAMSIIVKSVNTNSLKKIKPKVCEWQEKCSIHTMPVFTDLHYC